MLYCAGGGTAALTASGLCCAGRRNSAAAPIWWPAIWRKLRIYRFPQARRRLYAFHRRRKLFGRKTGAGNVLQNRYGRSGNICLRIYVSSVPGTPLSPGLHPPVDAASAELVKARTRRGNGRS